MKRKHFNTVLPRKSRTRKLFVVAWLTLFCENYYFTKKITNLRRKSRVKVQKIVIKVQKSGVKVQITNLRRKLLICEEKSRDQSPKSGVKVHITNLQRKLLFHKETTKLQNYYFARKITDLRRKLLLILITNL